MNQPLRETWAEYRRRILQETCRFIEWGLRHPELVAWIPVKPADASGFPRRVAGWFWGTVLSPRVDGAVTRWRQWLLDRPRAWLGRG
jgi:hypothetical protein